MGPPSERPDLGNLTPSTALVRQRSETGNDDEGRLFD
jgi:hypothetical protein